MNDQKNDNALHQQISAHYDAELQNRLNQAISAAPSFTWDASSDTGFYTSSSGTISFSVGGTKTFDLEVPTTVDDVYKLYFEGKTMKKDTAEYKAVIEKLKWVKGEGLKMVEAWEFFRRQLFPEDDEQSIPIPNFDAKFPNGMRGQEPSDVRGTGNAAPDTGPEAQGSSL